MDGESNQTDDEPDQLNVEPEQLGNRPEVDQVRIATLQGPADPAMLFHCLTAMAVYLPSRFLITI